MSKELRKKYKAKAVKIADLKAKTDAEDTIIGGHSKEDYLEIVDGKANKFRLFPPHDGPDFFIMRKRYWMEIPNDEGDLKKRVVNDSIIHGGTKFDIVQEYVEFCTKNIQDKEKIAIITDWKKGLKAELSWIAYAIKISGGEREFGLLQFKKQVRDALNKLMFVEDDDEPIETDPFTDIDDGTPILITYNKKPNKKKGEDYYTVQLAKKSDKLSDEELEIFENAKPLPELYRNTYGLRDFEKAIEGLKQFDMEHEIDAFDDDRFIEICEKVKAQYDDEDSDDDDEDEKPKKKSSKEVAKKPAKKVVVEDDDDDEEDEEEEAPKKSSKKTPKKAVVVEDDEDDEDEEEDEEEEETPAPKKTSKKPVKKVVDDEDSDDDDEDSDDDEEEEKPRKRMSLADVRAKLKNK